MPSHLPVDLDDSAFACHPDHGAPAASALASCASPHPGHMMHWIQAGLVRRSPQFWRAAIVTAVHEHAGGVRFTAAWAEDEPADVATMPGISTSGHGPPVTCWHHVPRPELCVGYPLRTRDEFGLAETGSGAFSVLAIPA